MFDKLAQCSGWQMYVNPNDNNVSEVIYQRGVWESGSTALVRENLREGDVFVDCGANIGYYTCLAATIVGEKGLVVALEPSPRHFAYLRKNVELNKFKNVITIQCALWHERAVLYLKEAERGNLGDTGVSTTAPPENVIPDEKVQAYPLDEIISRADFIKTDCQGTDPNVLRGCRKLIENSKNIKCLLEKEGNSWKDGLLDELHLSIVKEIPEDTTIFCSKNSGS